MPDPARSPWDCVPHWQPAINLALFVHRVRVRQSIWIRFRNVRSTRIDSKM